MTFWRKCDEILWKVCWNLKKYLVKFWKKIGEVLEKNLVKFWEQLGQKLWGKLGEILRKI